SAGNPSAVSEGRKYIWSSLLGILLLAGAYIILNTVNPNLLNLNLPTLSPVQTSSSGLGCSPSSCNGTCYGGTCYPDYQNLQQVCQSKGLCATASGSCGPCSTAPSVQSCQAQNLCYSITSHTCISCH
ncbi:MAG: hypothetical protein KGJ13_01105, partial [Patescibacteria group bacterium]|nr:hypothetical protein [Patescibacteria group bacterium]